MSFKQSACFTPYVGQPDDHISWATLQCIDTLHKNVSYWSKDQFRSILQKNIESEWFGKT